MYSFGKKCPCEHPRAISSVQLSIREILVKFFRLRIYVNVTFIYDLLLFILSKNYIKSILLFYDESIYHWWITHYFLQNRHCFYQIFCLFCFLSVSILSMWYQFWNTGIWNNLNWISVFVERISGIFVIGLPVS